MDFKQLKAVVTVTEVGSVTRATEDARRLLQLVHSIIMVAMCVEIWHRPRVVNSADAQIHRVSEPLP